MTTDILFTPWRKKYVTSDKNKANGCVFCAKLAGDVSHDRQNYTVYRSKTTFVVMNIYPYNTGHLMILPCEHVATLVEIARETQFEMMALTSYFTELLSQLMEPDGFNVGMNIGRTAGAGIVDHLHAHIVPRWNGDSNFMATIGGTRVLPEVLDDTYDSIVELINKRPPEIETLDKEQP